MPKYPVSDHCDGERFFNPFENARPLADVIKWARTRQRTPWPSRVALTRHDPPPAGVDPGRVAATFIGHSTFLLRTASIVILTDPVFTSTPGRSVGLDRARVRPPAIAAAAAAAGRPGPRQPQPLRSPAALVAAAVRRQPRSWRRSASRSSWDFRNADQIHELDWWETTRIGDAEVTCVPAQHFSARTPWDRNRTLWCGYIVRVDGVAIYFAGDTGYTPQFTEIGDAMPVDRLALLPIGAYEPRWFMRRCT